MRPPRRGNSIISNLPMNNCLRDIHLDGIDVGDQDIECLLSSCPLLEHVRLAWSPGRHKLEIAADQAPNLKYFDVTACQSLLRLDISTPSLESLVIEANHSLEHVELRAPNLKHLIIIDVVRSLKHVRISAPNRISFTVRGIWLWMFLFLSPSPAYVFASMNSSSLTIFCSHLIKSLKSRHLACIWPKR